MHNPGLTEKMDAKLVAVGGPLIGKTFPITGQEVSVGRDKSSTLCLNYGQVSRHHCLIKRDRQGFKITDLGSSNGTFVNGVPIRDQLLKHGDQIKVVSSLFLFLLDEGEELVPPDLVQLDESSLLSGETTYMRSEDSHYLGSADLLKDAISADRAARDLDALLKISTAISSIHGLERLHHRLLELILEVIPAKRGTILLVEEGGEDFRSVCCLEGSEGAVQPFQVSRTILEAVREQRAGILNNRRVEREVFEQAESLAGSGAESVLCVPLLVLEKLMGVIYLETSDVAAPFDEDHLHLLTAIASIAAVASQNALHVEWLHSENRRLREDIAIEHNMVGESEALLRVHQFIAKAAPTKSSVLIYGESGTGKELAAHALHRNSPRADKPFVTINCATLMETLLESELFGHEKGAFTGATSQKKGKLEVAHGGTVFLDEVGELAPKLQAKLLRVLQEHEFERVGGTHPIQVDIRVIAATNQDLEEAIQAKTFRSDLYYRLNVVSIEMPALRKRRDDIPLLTQYFTDRFSKECNRTISGISLEARDCLMHYSWPGNVRELQNVIERAVVLGSADGILREDLPEALLETEPSTGDPENYHEVIKEKKKELILNAVEKAKGNYTQAANLLKLHPNYLHRLIRNLDLKAELKNKTS